MQTTVLVSAAVNGRVEAVRLLLDAGADPGRVAAAGTAATTPLMGAATTGQLEVLRLL
jgi:ankyrin repeat protein